MRAEGVRTKRKLAPSPGITLLVSGASLYAADDAGEAFTDQEPSATEPECAPASGGGEDVIAAMFEKPDAYQDGTIDKNEAKNDAALSKSFKKIARTGSSTRMVTSNGNNPVMPGKHLKAKTGKIN